jgi:hypothetical protein
MQHRFTKTKLLSCPKCGKAFDGATAMLGDPMAIPKDGSVTLCINCAAVLQYGEGMSSLVVADTTNLPAYMRADISRLQTAVIVGRVVWAAKHN